MFKSELFCNVLKNQFLNIHLKNRIDYNVIISFKFLNFKRNSRVVRRRLTRLENEFEVTQDEVNNNKCSENDLHNLHLITKNPRNLEQLLVEPKPLGWELEQKSRTYWNKLIFEKNNGYMVAKVEHHSGKTLIEVSELDDSIKKFILGKNSLFVASFLGEIIAKRCLETGILYIYSDFTKKELDSKKLNAFVQSIEKNGVILKEPDFIYPRRQKDL